MAGYHKLFFYHGILSNTTVCTTEYGQHASFVVPDKIDVIHGVKIIRFRQFRLVSTHYSLDCFELTRSTSLTETA